MTKGAGLTALYLLLLAAGSAGLWKVRARETFRAGGPEISVYAVEPASPSSRQLAKHEPESGCYLGAYVDLDPAVRSTYTDRTGKVRRLPAEFERSTGRVHALYFFYLGYGRPAPSDWIEKLDGESRLVQIALEPNEGLGRVQDDEYLRSLADALGKTKARIFLRFASEMNGPWTAYHGNPALYVEKWRLVTRIMRERAPNVAMLWCPYTVPVNPIESYYPGDEYVDWVGVNLYSVLYYNQNRLHPGEHDHPADMLTWIYRRYAERKPIMICEYAAANFSALGEVKCPEFAASSIRALYASLPARFPRVKCVTYFSSNNLLLKHRLNNDYSVLSNRQVLEAYRSAIADPYFISTGASHSPVVPVPLEQRQREYGKLRVYARSDSPEGYVRVFAAGSEIFRSPAPGGEFEDPGTTVTAVLYSRSGRRLATFP